MDQVPQRDLEEVMDFDPEEGIANLERHLDRLKREADALGFKFDRHAVRNELQAATFGRQRAGKARLLLAPSGAIAIELTSCGG
jgi:para-aminobenzoate synthetase/4-amino-4-deoxychorismate lyase